MNKIFSKKKIYYLILQIDFLGFKEYFNIKFIKILFIKFNKFFKLKFNTCFSSIFTMAISNHTRDVRTDY